MLKKPHYSVPNEQKTSIINIYSYDGKRLTGTISNPYYERELYFDNIMQFAIIMEQLFDDIHYPPSSVRFRSFMPDNKTESLPVYDLDARILKPLESFRINVMYRYNASWQGSITWIEKSSAQQFRSFLELLYLINNALSSLEVVL